VSKSYLMESYLVATLAVVSGGLGAPALAATPTASSELEDSESGRHPASLAFDGLLATSWAEGETGNGEGTWLEVSFDRPVDIQSLSIWPGDLSGADRLLRESQRPRLATLTFDTGDEEPVTHDIRFEDPGELGPVRLDVMIDVPGARSVRITTNATHDRSLYSNMHIAEVAVNYVRGDVPDAVTDHLEWLKGEGSERAREDHIEEAQAAFDAIQAEEFGDMESLKTLMDWAADGAPFVRERIGRLPYGFRMHGVPADTKSLELLLTEKDPNAIPAIARAAVRSRGALQADLSRRVKMFEAFQDLKGGGKRNVAPWGEPGFSQGALRSFGEPLGLGVDQYGGVWVADVGNHRVQRYRLDTGMVEEVFGAEPGMTDVWFHTTRDPYASGSAPGTVPGQFSNPVDLAVIPGKEGDTVVVLDAKGRLSVITPDDQVSEVVQLPVTQPISDGVGGEGHVVLAKKDVVVVWGNELYVVDPDEWVVEGEAVGLQDGAPTGAVGLKNGKIGLVYGQQLILYSTDGFRFGDMLGDTLGEGFQDWAVALDEDGRMWAVTDKGEAIKYKKPGKVDYRVQIADYDLSTPRLAVFEDLVFVSSEASKILQADALAARDAAESGSTNDGKLDLPGDP